MTAGLIKDSGTLNRILGGLITILLIVLLWLTYQYIHITSNIVDVKDPGEIIVRQVRDVSELTTATFEMDAVVPVSEKGFIWVESNLLYIAHGSVRVGVNLNEFHSEDIEVEGDKITITLPPLKILDSKLDLEHSSVYTYNRGFLGWGPDVINLQSQAQKEALHKVEKAACQSWLIKQASERVEKTVDHLLNRVLKDRGYKVVVKTQLPDQDSCEVAK